MHVKKMDLTEGFLENPSAHMYDELRLKVELTEIKEPTEKAGDSEELSSFGLWKIEAINVKKGLKVLMLERGRNIEHIKGN